MFVLSIFDVNINLRLILLFMQFFFHSELEHMFVLRFYVFFFLVKTIYTDKWYKLWSRMFLKTCYHRIIFIHNMCIDLKNIMFIDYI